MTLERYDSIVRNNVLVDDKHAPDGASAIRVYLGAIWRFLMGKCTIYESSYAPPELSLSCIKSKYRCTKFSSGLFRRTGREWKVVIGLLAALQFNFSTIAWVHI